MDWISTLVAHCRNPYPKDYLHANPSTHVSSERKNWYGRPNLNTVEL